MGGAVGGFVGEYSDRLKDEISHIIVVVVVVVVIAAGCIIALATPPPALKRGAFQVGVHRRHSTHTRLAAKADALAPITAQLPAGCG